MAAESVQFCVSCGQNVASRAAPGTVGEPASADPPVTRAGPDTSGGPGTEASSGSAPGPESGPEAFLRYFPAADGPAPPDRPGRSALTAVLAAVLIVGAAAGGLLLVREHGSASAGPGHHTAAGQLPASTAASAGRDERAQVARLAAQVERSAAARSLVISATAAVGNCSIPPGRGIAMMRQAIGDRQAIISGLGGLPVSAVPGGQRTVADFAAVLRLSTAADQDFIGWMQDMQRARTCPVAAAADVSYRAGLRTSSQAAVAKEVFLARWNALASRLHQPTFTGLQI
jgi:hypothetical protein